jgi:hypothetical protein
MELSMTLSQRVAICLSLSFSIVTSAYADGPGNAAAPAAPSGRWTKDDVAAVCHNRFGADDRSRGYLACVDRNSARIGRDETPGEIQELDAAKAANSPQ